MASEPEAAGSGPIARLRLFFDFGHRLGREQVRAQMPIERGIASA